MWKNAKAKAKIEEQLQEKKAAAEEIRIRSKTLRANKAARKAALARANNAHADNEGLSLDNIMSEEIMLSKNEELKEEGVETPDSQKFKESENSWISGTLRLKRDLQQSMAEDLNQSVMSDLGSKSFMTPRITQYNSARNVLN